MHSDEFVKEWNERILVRDKSPVYQEMVRKEFSREKVKNNKELNAFFTTWTYNKDDPDYLLGHYTEQLPDFDGWVAPKRSDDKSFRKVKKESQDEK